MPIAYNIKKNYQRIFLWIFPMSNGILLEFPDFFRYKRNSWVFHRFSIFFQELDTLLYYLIKLQNIFYTFHNVRSSTCSGINVESIRRWCKRSLGSAPVNICFWIHEEAFLHWWLTSPSPERSDKPDKSDKFETVEDISSFSSVVSILKYYIKQYVI